MSESYELAVIGAGPAGLEAALTAAEAGVKTILIDNDPQAGGQYFKPLPQAFKASQHTRTEKEGLFLANMVNGMPLSRAYDALTWGVFKEEDGEGWLVALYGPTAPHQVRASKLILATGAYDLPVAFPGWTLPGVMTAGAALLLLKTQRVAPASRALVTGTGPLLLSVAAHLIEAGVEVLGVCESNRPIWKGLPHGLTLLGEWERLLEGAKYFNIMNRGKTPYWLGRSVVEAHGQDRVEEAIVSRVDSNGVPIPGTAQSIRVDSIICGYGLTPNTGLARMIGCEMEFNLQKGGWVPIRDATMRTSLAGVYVVGDGAGIGGAENSLQEGRMSGAAVAVETGHMTEQKAGEMYGRLKSSLAKQRRYGRMLGNLFTPPLGLISLAQDDTIICRCEEVTLGEVKAAVADGARTIGEVKMVTRTGMGNCQGRMCERSVAAAMVQALAAEQATPGKVGYYSIRPPLHPLPVGFLAEVGAEA